MKHSTPGKLQSISGKREAAGKQKNTSSSSSKTKTLVWEMSARDALKVNYLDESA